MLVLSRKLGEELMIGDTVVQVVRCGNHGVRLGIKAPDNVRILRRELAETAAATAGSGGSNANGGSNAVGCGRADHHEINESRKAEGPLAAELATAKAAPRRAG